MTPLRCCSFNCRCWNSGLVTLKSFIRYLLYTGALVIDHLHKIHEISPDFLSVSVSGRPYGGCSILYRKSLSSVISPLDSNSHHFCGIKMVDSMPTDYVASSVSDFCIHWENWKGS